MTSHASCSNNDTTIFKLALSWVDKPTLEPDYQPPSSLNGSQHFNQTLEPAHFRTIFYNMSLNPYAMAPSFPATIFQEKQREKKEKFQKLLST